MAPFFLPMIRIQTGSLKGMTFPFRPGTQTRPTTNKVREAVASIFRDDWQDAFVVDLFSGTGGYGLEALSNGSSRIIWVEKSKVLNRELEQTLRSIDRIPKKIDLRFVTGDVLSFMENWEESSADILTIDPPYGYIRKTELLSRLRSSAIVGANTRFILEFHHKDLYTAELLATYDLELIKMYTYGESRVALIRRRFA
jgi:16S rRNA (guanine966-N2)-methyltransferase